MKTDRPPTPLTGFALGAAERLEREGSATCAIFTTIEDEAAWCLRGMAFMPDGAEPFQIAALKPKRGENG